ncbi:MAG: L-threonylcarbamoyladenylate synthase [Ilumatobacteraceae bacterium]|nr:L-threonylcarbamoyladenylate synthase [Ilumatobacteraceae bacterium]
MISSDVGLAADRLRAGGVVAIPTETVYGLAADARNPAAVARIFEIKGRPTDHPLIVHLGSADELVDWAATVDSNAARLATTCWPGPLTMLVPKHPDVDLRVTGGRPTVGLRVPSHPVADDLLRRFGSGLAAPSANRFGKVSPTTAQHVLDDLGGILDPDRDLILDGGPSVVGVESTIVDLTVDPPQVLRAGAISADDLRRILATEVAEASGPSRASGMLESHYAPACAVEPVDDRATAERLAAQRRTSGERVEVLDRTDDLVIAANHLFADLRAADAAGLDRLIVVLPPASGIGHAIRDRLFKASATRPDPASRDG